jgi:hypothetical protein
MARRAHEGRATHRQGGLRIAALDRNGREDLAGRDRFRRALDRGPRACEGLVEALLRGQRNGEIRPRRGEAGMPRNRFA